MTGDWYNEHLWKEWKEILVTPEVCTHICPEGKWGYMTKQLVQAGLALREKTLQIQCCHYLHEDREQLDKYYQLILLGLGMGS